VTRLQPEGPYLLAGYSAFTTVIFETARQLRAAGREVALVVLYEAVRIPLIKPDDRARRRPGPSAAATAPDEIHPPGGGTPKFRRRFESVKGKIMTRLHWAMLHIPFLANSRSIPPWLRVLHAGMSYRPGRYDGRVVIYSSTQTYDRFGGDAYRAAWEKLAGHDLRISLFEGSHSCMFAEPQFGEMIQDLEQELARVGASAAFASMAGAGVPSAR
jgi:phthiocerol/phenolphthiocerol synthesis type-I polyketide synthase A